MADSNCLRLNRVEARLTELGQRFMAAWGECTSSKVTLLLSGGGDSVALFFLLRQAEVEFSCLHFVHGDSDFHRQARSFCRDLCARFGVPLRVEEIRVRGEGAVSWEAEARRLRYERVDSLEGVSLTAHTADDQAETLVMRLLDGSGLAGLAGVRCWRGSVFRPLLRFRRSELREFLRQRKESWLEDPTNLDGNDRGRLRSRVMPVLESVRPGLVKTLGRTASELALDEDGLRGEADRFLRERTLEGDHWRLSELRGLHPSVRHRFLRSLWRRTAPRTRPLGGIFREAERLLLEGGDDRGLLFGQVRLRILGQCLWLEPLDLPGPVEVTIPPELSEPLRGKGWAVFPPDFGEVFGGVGLALPGKVFASDVAYAVRTRRPGDRFRGKELKKLLAELGHPPWVRDRWPLLIVNGEIVAVPGLGPEARAGQGCLVFDPWSFRWRLEG